MSKKSKTAAVYFWSLGERRITFSRRIGIYAIDKDYRNPTRASLERLTDFLNYRTVGYFQVYPDGWTWYAEEEK